MTNAEKVKKRQEFLENSYESAISEGRHSYILKRVCPYCGKVFYTRNKRQIYCPDTGCGSSCALKANKERRKELHAEECQKTCIVCGHTFTAKKVDALYCSAACKQKAYRRRVGKT